MVVKRAEAYSILGRHFCLCKRLKVYSFKLVLRSFDWFGKLGTFRFYIREPAAGSVQRESQACL